MRVVCLGAGQDVGRSCVVVQLAHRCIMFDCGAHMGYTDRRRFPDFAALASDQTIDVVCITHFHLDHCGALPYFTEKCGYLGPVVMSAPTRAISAILLDDFRRVAVDRRGEDEGSLFSREDIDQCMKRIQCIRLRERILLLDDIEITAYYAGHVLGAVMFFVQVGNESVFYTGDYNMTPDRHLGAACAERLHPTLLITESTYATTVRDSKRTRESEFLSSIHECVLRGGKVLIPVFALGRAQELCILIETYWERMGLDVPVYFSAGLVERANMYYQLYIQWTNQKIKSNFAERNAFDFKHIRSFERAMLKNPGPCVLFATPGMLHGGLSLEVFKMWCGDPNNSIIIPGYCVAGTVGNKVLRGDPYVDIGNSRYPVRMKVQNMSFSAHTDAKGILQLIRQVRPENIMLVHGEREKMKSLSQRINRDLGLPVYDPPNGSMIQIEAKTELSCVISSSLSNHIEDLAREKKLSSIFSFTRPDANCSDSNSKNFLNPNDDVIIEGVVVADSKNRVRPLLVTEEEARREFGIRTRKIKQSATFACSDEEEAMEQFGRIYEELSDDFGGLCLMRDRGRRFCVSSLSVFISGTSLLVSWNHEDSSIAERVLFLLETYSISTSSNPSDFQPMDL